MTQNTVVIEIDRYMGGPVIAFTWLPGTGIPVAHVSANINQFGYTADGLTTGNVSYLALVYPDDVQMVVEHIQKHTTSGDHAFEHEYRLVCANGEIRWVYAYVHIVRDERGNATKYTGYLLDITEKKLYEDEVHRLVMRLEKRIQEQSETVRKSQELLQRVVDNIPSAIYVCNMQGLIILANKKCESLLHAKHGTLIGRAFADILSHEHADAIAQTQHQVLDRRKAIQTEEVFETENGDAIYLSIAFPIFGPKKFIYAIGGILTDITAQRKSEQEHAALQQQMIDAQQAVIQELSTPLMPLAPGVLVMPLLGMIDTTRALQMMETLLEGVATHQAHTVLLDVTGLSCIDTQLASTLVRSAQAATLLGAQVLVTGINPQIAQSLVSLGDDIQGVTTFSTLHHGVSYALQRRTRANNTRNQPIRS